MSDFHRIKRLPPYVFEQVNRIKAAEDAMEQARTANEKQAAEARDLAAKPAPGGPAARPNP